MQREASDKEKAKDLPTFKDNDFLNEKMTIQIGDASKERLMENIQADVQVRELKVSTAGNEINGHFAWRFRIFI